MAGHAAWVIGCFVTGCFLLPPTSNVCGHFHAYPSHYQSWLRYQPPPPPRPPRQPIDLMTDAINRLGMRVLQQYVEPGNVAFSPAGLGFILAALYEGSAGKSRQQIVECLGLPHDRNVVRVGMRDIHRRLRTYLNPDGFLGGLNLNRENTSLRTDYEGILRFYGFDLTIDLSNFTANATAGNFGLRGSMTTPNPLSTQAFTTDAQADSTTTPVIDTTMTTMPPTTANVINTDAGAAAATMITTTTGAPTTTIDTSVVIISNPTTMLTTAAQTMTTPSPTTTPITTPPTPASIQATTSPPTTTTTMPTTTTTTTQATTTTTMPTTTTTQPTTTTAQTSAMLSSTLPRMMMTSLGPTSADLPTTTQFMILEDIATVLPPTLIPSFRKKRSSFNRRRTRLDPNGDRRRRSYSEGYFSSYPDDGLWMQDLGIWSDQQHQQQLQIPSNIRDPGELQFLVNGCEFASVLAASYTSVLPFAYFPTLKASALEFPLDNPRYNVLLLLPNEKHDAQRLSRELSGQNLRLLRNQLQPTTVRATIPSFSLRGFVTLTSYLQRLGVRDVFEPRLADLSPMTPDLNVYARDIQQSIAVNIRNYMNGDASGMPQNPMQADLSQRRDPWRYQRPVNDRYSIVPFIADHPFLYFIIDDETSVALIAGRIDDPLNSRIL
ncbi:uncharacterized protein LOC131669394 [Phymastichus coffea]|uniref:uncharacterized protein LOC131669394 n=1 Tax=Phymastichus coffea TaxID=108790 RepID=UPI00273C776D|nr:uncharacterized protein LOC131669394 [Phymastichus coffea]